MSSLSSVWYSNLTGFCTTRGVVVGQVTPEVFTTLLQTAAQCKQHEFLERMATSMHQTWVQTWLRSADNGDERSRLLAWLNPMVDDAELRTAFKDGLIKDTVYQTLLSETHSNIPLLEAYPQHLKDYVNLNALERLNCVLHEVFHGWWATIDNPDETHARIWDVSQKAISTDSGVQLALAHQQLLAVLANPNLQRVPETFESQGLLDESYISFVAGFVNRRFNRLSSSVQQFLRDQLGLYGLFNIFSVPDASLDQLNWWKNLFETLQPEDDISHNVMVAVAKAYGELIELDILPARYVQHKDVISTNRWVTWLQHNFGTNTAAWKLMHHCVDTYPHNQIGVLRDSVKAALQ